MSEYEIFKRIARLLKGKTPLISHTWKQTEGFLFQNRLKRSSGDIEDESNIPNRDVGRSGLPGRLLGGLMAFALAIVPLAQVLAAPFITLSSFSGSPGVNIQVSGGGYQAGEAVNVYVGSSGTPAATATATTDSLFGPVSVSIPMSSPQGPVTISSVGSTSGISQSNSYYVVPYSASISVESTANTPGSVMTVSGSGFAPGEGVELSMEGAAGPAVTANSSGNFSGAKFTVPNLPAGTYQVHAKGKLSGAHGLAYFYVGGFYPSANPSSYYLMPGETLTFYGSGFMGGEKVSVSESGGATVSTIATDSAGSFEAAGAYQLPLSSANTTRSFTLTGQTSGLSVSGIQVTVGQFFPNVFPSAYYLPPTENLTFSGGGFAPNEKVNIYEGNNPTPINSFTTDKTGSYSEAGSLNVPYTYAGSDRTFRLVGQQSNAAVEVTVSIGQYYPQISLSEYYVLPGKTVTVYGGWFAHNETVTIAVDGLEPIQVTADKTGALPGTTFTVPFTDAPMLSITATGANSKASVSTSITLGAYWPSVTPSGYWLQQGSNLTFAGSGFAPNESVTVRRGETDLGTLNTDAAGALTAVGNSFIIPFGGAGTFTYNFTGMKSKATVPITIVVPELAPYAEADNYYVTPGSTVNVRGYSFGGGEGVTVTVGGVSVTTTATATGTTPAVPITIPLGMSNSATIQLTGQKSGASATVPVTLAPFSAQVTPSTWWTMPGSAVTFEGSGFAGGETVTVSRSGTELGTVKADTKGAFATQAYTIPYGSTGADFSFTGQQSGATAQVAIGLGSLTPGIWLSTYYDTPGAALTVFGSGFGANEKVAVTFGGKELGTATTNATGDFELAATVPMGPAGSKSIEAKGASSGMSAPAATFTQPENYVTLELGSYSGAPGEPITFVGSGYLPGEPMEVRTDRTGSTVVHTFTASATGAFSNSGYVAPSPGGSLMLIVRGTISGAEKSIVYWVTGP